MPPPDVALFLTTRYINGVSRCVVLTGSEDPCCSCSWSTYGSTSLALIPPTPECSSSSSPAESSQPVRRELLRPSSDAWIVPPPDVVLFLTTRYVNEVRRGVVFPGSEDPCCSCSFSTRGGTSAALIPPTLVDSGTGGRRLRVSDTNRLKFRCIRLGRMSVCLRKCRKIRSQLRKSDARPIMYKTRPSAVSEETPTSELLPCLVIQLSVNTGCRSRYVISPYEDGLLFQSNTTG